MAVGNEDVAVALDEVNRVQGPAHDEPGEGELHRPPGLDAAGFRVIAEDLEPDDLRSALAVPNVGLELLRVGRPVVRAEKPECGPRPCHDETCGPAAIERCETNAVEVDHERPGQPVDAGREPNLPDPRVDRLLYRRRVVGLAVAHRTKIADAPAARLARVTGPNDEGKREGERSDEEARDA